MGKVALERFFHSVKKSNAVFQKYFFFHTQFTFFTNDFSFFSLVQIFPNCFLSPSPFLQTNLLSKQYTITACVIIRLLHITFSQGNRFDRVENAMEKVLAITIKRNGTAGREGSEINGTTYHPSHSTNRAIQLCYSENVWGTINLMRKNKNCPRIFILYFLVNLRFVLYNNVYSIIYVVSLIIFFK